LSEENQLNPKVALLEQAVHSALHPIGFKKQKLVWRRYLPDMIQVVGLEKWSVSLAYNLIVGLNLLDLSNDQSPSINLLHVNWSYTELVGRRLSNDFIKRGEVLEALNLENEIPDQERVGRLAESLRLDVLPLMQFINNLKNLRESLTDGHIYRTSYHCLDKGSISNSAVSIQKASDPIKQPEVNIKVKRIKH